MHNALSKPWKPSETWSSVFYVNHYQTLRPGKKVSLSRGHPMLDLEKWRATVVFAPILPLG
jgi:hypothetical protein